MTGSLRTLLLAGALLASALVGPSALWAAGIPQDACQIFRAEDFKALGISAAPKGRVAKTPNQDMSTCGAGSVLKPPMLGIMIQDIKMPIAVQMGRKNLASEKGEVVAGPWDAGKVTSGTDGSQFHFFKGNVSVLIMCSATTPAARTMLVEIAKRAAAAL